MEVEDINNEKKDDDSETTEEVFVHINFEELLDDCPDEEVKNLKMIGIDSKEPFLQIGNKIFGGVWKEPVGTALFFEDADPVTKKCYFSPDIPHPLKLSAKSQKSLYMRRIFVNPKAKVNEDENCDQMTENNTLESADTN